MIGLVLALYLGPNPARAANVFAGPCVKATISAIACCGRWHCDTQEILAEAGHLFDAKTRDTATRDDAQDRVGAERLAKLLTKDASVQVGLAELCKSRAETCLKHCGNAVKLGPLEKIMAYKTNQATCTKLQKRGEAVAYAGEGSEAAENRKKEAAARILGASADLSGATGRSSSSSESSR